MTRRWSKQGADSAYEWVVGLILEMAGLHPRLDRDPDWAEMLRRYRGSGSHDDGWRPFKIYHVKG